MHGSLPSCRWAGPHAGRHGGHGIPLTCMKPMLDAWLWAERVLAMEEAQLADFVQGRVSLRPDQQQVVSHGMYTRVHEAQK